MRILIPMLLLAGCATIRSDVPTGEAGLVQQLTGRVGGGPVDCVDTNLGLTLDIVSADTLVYRTGGTIWVNRLPSACPGLRPLARLVIEPGMSGRYCRNDRFRSLHAGSDIPGASCRLGAFTPWRRP